VCLGRFRQKFTFQIQLRHRSSLGSDSFAIATIITAPRNMSEGKAVGIDLSATYYCVAVWQSNRVEIIANDQGNRTAPSYFALTDSERFIGDAAKNQVAMNPYNTVVDGKRLIGGRFNDPEVQSHMKHRPSR
jgi:molecular chaperone DnaK (HSP70)